MTLTEALRQGTPEAFGALYDEHAEQLYAYCHTMVGEEAADAVCAAFVAIAQHPDSVPADEDTLPVWVHAMARAECVRRGALVRSPATTTTSDPVWRALAGLDPEDREAIVLTVALVPEEIAFVLGVTRDTAESLARGARQRLEHALSVAGGQEAHDPVVVTSLNEVTLRRLVMGRYEPPPHERERVLSSCAAAEGEDGGTLVFDADGMPVVLDAPTASLDEPALTPAEDAPEEPALSPAEAEPRPSPSEDSETEGRETRRRRARRRREPFRARRIEGLLQVAGLAALVLVAVGVMTLRAGHSGGSSDEGGKGHSPHRKGHASPSVQQPPPGFPPQAEPTAQQPSVPGAAPGDTAPADQRVPLPPGDGDSAYPIPPPSYPGPPSYPHPPGHHPTWPTRTPTPSDSPTGKESKTPTPRPSGS